MLVTSMNPIGFTVSVPIHPSIWSIERRPEPGDANLRSHDFHDGCAVQRLKRSESMTAQDLLSMYSKSQVERGRAAQSSSPPL